MIFGIISFIFSAACLLLFLISGEKNRKYDKVSATAASVRISFFLCLCAVPFLAFISMVVNSTKWASYAVSAVIVEGCASLLIGLMALLQRYGALFFKMEPAMDRNEILVLIFLPVILYLSYLPYDFIVLYYLGPGIYSAYLLSKLTKNK
jgi:hypothetical protein